MKRKEYMNGVCKVIETKRTPSAVNAGRDIHHCIDETLLPCILATVRQNALNE